MMDIFELDDALGDEDRHLVEEALLAAVRRRLDQCWRDIEVTFADRAEVEGDPERLKWADVAWQVQCDARRFIMNLLRVIAKESDDPWDPIFDCAEISKLLQNRAIHFGAQAGPLTALPSKRGPRARYPWPEFVAEAARYCAREAPAQQSDVEQHMARWCSEKWAAEPAESSIRDWIAPIFRAINQD